MKYTVFIIVFIILTIVDFKIWFAMRNERKLLKAIAEYILLENKKKSLLEELEENENKEE